MSEVILVAIISFFGTVIGVVIGFAGVKVKSKTDIQINKDDNEYDLIKQGFDKKIDDVIKTLNEQKKELSETKKSINETLESHRKEYITGIDEVKSSISDMKIIYNETVAVVELKIDNLEKKQDKHNNLIERTFNLEKETAVQLDMIKNAHHRLDTVEKKVLKN